MPTIIVAVFSYLFFSFGVEAWFSDKVRTAISESVAVAEAYVKEHQQAIRADALAMANDLNRYCRRRCQLNPQYLAPVVDRPGGDARADRGRGVRRQRDDAGAHRPRLRARLRGGQQGRAAAAPSRARSSIMTDDQDDRVRALVRLDEFSDLYLYVGRFIEPRVLAHRDETQRAAAQYEQLEGQRSGLPDHLRGASSSWWRCCCLPARSSVGIHFATQLAEPISRLVGAAERVRAGDLSARVPEGEKDDELVSLSRAFNRMTNQLESQQQRADRGQPPARRAAAFHRNGAAGRLGRGHRPRPRRPHQSAQPLGLGAARRRSRPVDRRGSGRGRARDGRPLRRRRRGAPTGWRRRRSRSPAPTARARCWCASPPSRIEARSAAMS